MKYLDEVYRLAAKATRKGGSLKSLTKFEWDLAGKCERPLVRTVYARPDAVTKTGKEVHVGRSDNIMTAVPMEGVLHVRCRKCDPCKRFRAMEWRDRILYELHRAIRTWFGTLTLHPDIHFRMLLEAERKYDAAGSPGDFASLSQDEQFNLVCRLIYREVQKYWKRIRKKNTSFFKYVVVFEKHTDKLAGLPHVHFLCHERSGKILHRELSREWELGHTNFKLVEGDRSADYITKYLVKEAVTRIRGSTDYGRDKLLTAEAQAADACVWPRLPNAVRTEHSEGT